MQIYPKHYCGVFGVFGHPNAAELAYYGLYALQHRGQESAGIVTAGGPDRKFKSHHGMGLVPQVFNAQRYPSFDFKPYPTIQKIFANCMKLDAFDRARPEKQPDAE